MMRVGLGMLAMVLALGGGGNLRAEDDEHLLLTDGMVRSSLHQDVRISIGDAYTAPFIKSRFGSFKVEFSDDCEIECFVVSRGPLSFLVFGSESDGKIYGLQSFSKGAKDVFGNTVGMSLRKALMSKKASCQLADGLVCQGQAPGLSYFVSGGEECDWGVDWSKVSDAPVRIPECARIDGLWLSRAD